MNYSPTWMTGTRPVRTAIRLESAGGCDAPIRHPGWCMAYSQLLAGLDTGSAFLALLGPAGTGKTWLLQAVMAALHEQGRPVKLVRRGELAVEAPPETVLLIDEAARMDDAKLAQLAKAGNAAIVVAGLPEFAARLEQLARYPDVVPLLPLPPGDVPGFTKAWLASHGVPAEVLTGPAVERLSGHSGGVPRLAVQFLRAALAIGGTVGVAGIGADEVDEVAALRLGGLDGEVATPAADDPPAPAMEPAPIASAGSASAAIPPDASSSNASMHMPARPRVRRRAGLAVTLAAACLLGAVVSATWNKWQSGDPGPAVALSQAVPAGAGDAPDRDAGPMTGVTGTLPVPPVVAEPGPVEAPAGVVPDTSAPASAAQRPRLPSSSVPRGDAVLGSRAGQEGGAPGLLLLARAGDTMPSLYAKVYRGLRPPPYADVVAANHLPIKPGAILVFPAPLAGWTPR